MTIIHAHNNHERRSTVIIVVFYRTYVLGEVSGREGMGDDLA